MLKRYTNRNKVIDNFNLYIYWNVFGYNDEQDYLTRLPTYNIIKSNKTFKNIGFFIIIKFIYIFNYINLMI